jgi:hypothetical protein
LCYDFSYDFSFYYLKRISQAVIVLVVVLCSKLTSEIDQIEIVPFFQRLGSLISYGFLSLIVFLSVKTSTTIDDTRSVSRPVPPRISLHEQQNRGSFVKKIFLSK